MTIMKLCVTDLDFVENLEKNPENGPKTGVFLLKKFIKI